MKMSMNKPSESAEPSKDQMKRKTKKRLASAFWKMIRGFFAASAHG